MSNPTNCFRSLAMSAAGALILAGAASAASAQQPTAQPPAAETARTPDAKDTRGDAKGDAAFVKEAAAGGVKEVEAGRLAAERATNADVKAFGQKMVDDHTKANEELKSIASSKQLTLPSEEDAKAKATKALARLGKLQGAAFDQAYVNEMVKDHQKAVALFERESTSGQDAELKAFAAKTLPALKDHMRMVTELRAKVGGKSS